ncbi:MAG: hypothetical protein O3A95_03415 [Planctomycetota bacterium]|nr:hypothetical protein [Planctomycetota bacterium]MDA1113330.1 hypothetical protein [Planctomycetota bacterium]
MGFSPRNGFIFLLLLVSLSACNGGSSTAQLNDAVLPESLRGGLTVSGPEAAETFNQWRDALPQAATLPVSVDYTLNAKFEQQSSDPEISSLSGSATGNFTYQGIDAQRSRLDAFLVLRLPEKDANWNLTGSMLCDDFFTRAWGTAHGIAEVDPDKVYAVQFEQTVFERAYSSLTRLMPKFLNSLEGYGIAGSAFLREGAAIAPAHLFHPRHFLDLTVTAISCRSLRFEDNRIDCKLGLNLNEGTPLHAIFSNLLDGPEQALLTLWANSIVIDAVFEARTGVLIGAKFQATYPPAAALTGASTTTIEFVFESTEIEWMIQDLDRALDRPDVDAFDLTAMLQLADKFLREQGDKMDAEKDFEF